MNKKHIIIAIVLIVVVISLAAWQLLFHPPLAPMLPEQYCTNAGEVYCHIDGELPPEWNTARISPNDITCEEILGCSSCSECGFPMPE